MLGPCRKKSEFHAPRCPMGAIRAEGGKSSGVSNVGFLMLMAIFFFFGYWCVLKPERVKSQPGGHVITRAPIWFIRVLGIFVTAMGFLFLWMFLAYRISK